MNLKKTAKMLKRASLALIVAATIMCATSGCNLISSLGELNYLGQWATSLLGSSTST
jgi:hypothetical protein